MQINEWTNSIPREPIMVFEGQEKENFWNVLGGQKPYVNDKRLQVCEQVFDYHMRRMVQLFYKYVHIDKFWHNC